MPNTSENRKTYSLDPDRSRQLSRHALDLGDDLKRTVPKQLILDTLVSCLEDSGVYAMVKGRISKS